MLKPIFNVLVLHVDHLLNGINVTFLASEILFSNTKLMQLRRTSSLRALCMKRCARSACELMFGPIGTILLCAGRICDNLK